MTHLNPDNLRTTLETAKTQPTWKAIFASIGACESTAFNWLNSSQRDADRKLGRESKYFVEWGGVWDYWAPGHLTTAKKFFASHMERRLFDAAANDYTEIATNPQTGEYLQRKIPAYAHYSRERCIEEGLDPDIDIYEWEHDPISGERIYPLVPCYVLKKIRSSAMLKLRAAASQINAWSDRSVQEVNVSGHVSVMHVAPPRFVPKAIRDQSDIVDADFQAVESEPKSITDLRAFAQRHLDPNNVDRVTKPDAPVLDATGRPVGKPVDEFVPDHENGEGVEDQPPMTVSADSPRPKETRAYAQPSERPAYARKGPLNDPHHPSAKAMKVVR